MVEPVYNVTICGGGNLAHASIATIGHNNPKYRINVLSRRPEVWGDQIKGVTNGSAWEYKGELVGKINKVSADPAEVIPGTDIVIVCSPAHTKIEILEQIKPHLGEKTMIGTIFGQGGFDLQCKYVLGDDIENKQLTIFSTQYVPFICKAFNYGKECMIIGPKKHLYVASYPIERVYQCCQVMSLLYTIPCIVVPNFLNLTLCPSNQIIHPGRVYNFFKNWDGQSTFKKSEMPLLYEDIDEGSADEIQFLDNEIQAIKAALVEKYPSIDLSQVQPIKDRICSMYEGQVSDSSTLQKVFSTNQGYKKVVFPMVPVDPADQETVTLNLKARFFWEDMPFGCVILKNIGQLVGVETPNIDKQIAFHQKFMPVKYIDEANKFIEEALKDTGAPTRYGVNSADDLVKTSLPQ